MLHRYTDQERTAVRSKYSGHVMLRLAEAVCRQYDSQLQDFSMWPEELFIWSAVILDNVKENGDEYMPKLGNLWKEHYSAFRKMDKSVPVDELQLAASIVMCVPVLMLQTSTDSVQRYMGKQMLDSVSMNYEDWEKLFGKMAAICNRMQEGMGVWLNAFMALDNDQYLSDEIAELLEPMAADTATDDVKGATYVTVQAGAEYVQQKTVERAIGKVEAGGTGFAESSEKKED